MVIFTKENNNKSHPHAIFWTRRRDDVLNLKLMISIRFHTYLFAQGSRRVARHVLKGEVAVTQYGETAVLGRPSVSGSWHRPPPGSARHGMFLTLPFRSDCDLHG